MKNICVVTGTRAEFGLLRQLMELLENSIEFNLQIVATGTHLSPEFGFTIEEVSSTGFTITKQVEMLLSSDSPTGITKSLGLGVIGFADALNDLNPDLLIILGDRYEGIAAALAGLISRIPIAHIHGGEITEGSIDDAIRHSITKMSQIHFVAAKEYQNRVIQLGEDPASVFLVGGLGVDNLKNTPLLSKLELEDSLGLKFSNKNLLITYHPDTVETQKNKENIKELLVALDNFNDTKLIFTAPNSDAYGHMIYHHIKEFVARHTNAHILSSLGSTKYLSCLREVDAVVGNSSSGLLEAPSFPTACVNIGNRQNGRIKAKSVIDCKPISNEIQKAIAEVYTETFKSKIQDTKNPYGNGGASLKIIQSLKKIEFGSLKLKPFHDIKVN